MYCISRRCSHGVFDRGSTYVSYPPPLLVNDAEPPDHCKTQVRHETVGACHGLESTDGLVLRSLLRALRGGGGMGTLDSKCLVHVPLGGWTGPQHALHLHIDDELTKSFAKRYFYFRCAITFDLLLVQYTTSGSNIGNSFVHLVNNSICKKSDNFGKVTTSKYFELSRPRQICFYRRRPSIRLRLWRNVAGKSWREIWFDRGGLESGFESVTRTNVRGPNSSSRSI